MKTTVRYCRHCQHLRLQNLQFKRDQQAERDIRTYVEWQANEEKVDHAEQVGSGLVLAHVARRLRQATERTAMSNSCNTKSTGTVQRPLLFVDIDGVLNPYGGPCPDRFTEHRLFPDDDEPVRVCPRHGEWLHELTGHYELMWGSSWSDEERAMLSGVLELPYFHGAVELPRGPFDPALKAPAVDCAAGKRSLAWIDDMLTPEA